MGLDMYLTKKTYIGAEYEHRGIKGEISLTTNGKPIKINLNRVSYIDERVGYWRKANHIHLWFVNNVQDGQDNCQEYSVSIENLEDLLSACKAVKVNPGEAHNILPTVDGFFFGGTNYNQYYFDEIDATINIIEGLIEECKEDENFYIYYQSSW